MGPEMLLLVGAGGGGEGAGRKRVVGWGAQGNDWRWGGGGSRGREAMPPITIIFHHPNYIVECVSAAACAHPALLLLGKDRGRET